MKTITRTYNVYSFDELSDEAKDKAHSEYLRNGDYWFWGNEAKNTMKEIEDLFHIKLRNWCIDTYKPEYPDIEFEDDFWEGWDDSCDYYNRANLKGNRARAFLWNNFGHVLTEPKHHYRNGKCVKSRVFTTRVYDGACPLTGYCFDCDALDPLAYFCFGVEWNEAEKKRTMTKDRTLSHDNSTTVEDVIRDCVHSMFRSFIMDVEWYESRECFEKECSANGWTFLEDGKMMNY